MKIYIYLITVLFSSTIFAIESSDILKVSVIKHYDKNVLVLNRGLEDGIYKADHIKLTNLEGYIARAICIKASMLMSHWKVYRVVRPELMSYDSVYTLTSMNQSEIPKELQAFQKALFNDDYNDISDKDVNKVIDLQQERIASFDLPKNMEYDPLLEEANTTDGEKFIKKNFDLKQMGADLSKFKFSFYTSPYSNESRTNQKQENYGINFKNIGEKYLFGARIQNRESTAVDKFTSNQVSSKESRQEIDFTLRNLSKNTDYYMLYRVKKGQVGDTVYPKDHTQIGLLGFTWHLSEEIKDERFKFSYITLIDNLVYQYNDTTGELRESSEGNIRHGMHLDYNTRMSKNSIFNLDVWYQPLMNLEKQEFDFSNTMTEASATIAWEMNKTLNLEYVFTYTNDSNLKTVYNINAVNQINTFNIRYNLDL
jgi:hypothetical protein